MFGAPVRCVAANSTLVFAFCRVPPRAPARSCHTQQSRATCSPTDQGGGKRQPALLDNPGNCYLRTKGALTPAGQTKPLTLQQYGTPCCNHVPIGVVPALGKAMRRRDFIKVIAGSAAAWPLAAGAQQPTMPVIGFLFSSSPDTNPDRLRGFQRGLKETGYIEGENVAIVNRPAEGQYDRLPALAAELARQKATVILAMAEAAALAIKVTATKIPVIFLVSSDPVELGLVPSVARPGGNWTGINFVSNELIAKRFGLLHEMLPAAVRVAVLVNPK